MGIGIIGATSSVALPIGASAKVLEVNSKKFRENNISVTPGTYLVKASVWYSDAPVIIIDNLGNRYQVKGDKNITFPSGVTSVNLYTGVDQMTDLTILPSGRATVGTNTNSSTEWAATGPVFARKSNGFYMGGLDYSQSAVSRADSLFSLDGKNWSSLGYTSSSASAGATLVDVDARGNRVAVRYNQGGPATSSTYDAASSQVNSVNVGSLADGYPYELLVTKSIFPNVHSIVAINNVVWYSNSTGSSWSSYTTNQQTTLISKRTSNRVVLGQNAGTIKHTSNGSSWTNLTIPNAAGIGRMDFNGSLWVIADGNATYYWTSTDLVTFTQRTHPGSGYPAIKLFWAKEESLWYYFTTMEAFTSPDGITWTKLSELERTTWIGAANTQGWEATTDNLFSGSVADTSDVVPYSEVIFNGRSKTMIGYSPYRKTAGFSFALYNLESAAI